MKRLLDIVFAFFGLVALSPTLIIFMCQVSPRYPPTFKNHTPKHIRLSDKQIEKQQTIKGYR